MSNELAGLFGRGVGRHRRVDDVRFPEDRLRRAAVDARRRREDEGVVAVLRRQLQQQRSRLDVRSDVGDGVVDRRPDSGPRGEVDHPPRRVLRPDRLHHGLVADVRLHELERLLVPLEQRHVLHLHRRAVVVVHLVDADHPLTPLQQLLRHVAPDEPRDARHQDPPPLGPLVVVARHHHRVSSPLLAPRLVGVERCWRGDDRVFLCVGCCASESESEPLSLSTFQLLSLWSLSFRSFVFGRST
mmetsp:Transcript_25664/g.83187  ORF Transcript_25664/g.83187 Transcript_25664/m.83187 type:complete len:243 (+) Transcript_25664:1459-2187(+)